MTQRRVRLTPQAQDDYLTKVDWWRENRPAAPRLLEEEIAAALARLANAPMSGVAARDARLAGVRRKYLRATRYWIYYRVREQEAEVEVLRIWQANRGEAPEL